MNIRLVALFILACLLVRKSDGAEIHGLVLDQESNPIEGKVIPLIPDRSSSLNWEARKEAITNPSGEFNFVDLGIGNYYLIGPGKGYRSHQIEILETSEIVSDIIFTPVKTNYILNVRIMQIPKSSDPLTVRLFPGPLAVMSVFNTHGIKSPSDPSTYIFTNLYEGTYILSIAYTANVESVCTVNISENPEQLSFIETTARLNPFVVKLWQDENEQEGRIWSAGAH